MTGVVSASEHTPGNEITGQASNLAEKIITIDNMLIAPVFLANVDEAMAHYDVRGEYSKQAGEALASTWDQHVLQCMVLAARESTIVTGLNGGTELTSSSTLYKTSAADLADGLFEAVEAFADKNVPIRDLSAYMKPAQYFMLARSPNLMNKDWGGAGSFSQGKVGPIAGVELVMTNNLPTTNINSGNAKYQGDFTKTAAVVCNRMAAGTVKLINLQTESQYDVRRQGTLIVSKYLCGHDFLRPDCSVELKTAS